MFVVFLDSYVIKDKHGNASLTARYSVPPELWSGNGLVLNETETLLIQIIIYFICILM
jgi:hypothetical protein